MREPDNPHDANAVRVELPGGGEWRKVGYISAQQAWDYAQLLDPIGGVATCMAGLVRQTGGRRLPAVFLYLADADDALIGSLPPEGSTLLWAERQCAVVGEQHHQDQLVKLPIGTDRLWFTLARGSVSSGKYQGSPTLVVLLDDQRVGELTFAQGSRYGRVLWPLLDRGSTLACEGLVSQGQNKLEVTLWLPRVDQ